MFSNISNILSAKKHLSWLELRAFPRAGSLTLYTKLYFVFAAPLRMIWSTLAFLSPTEHHSCFGPLRLLPDVMPSRNTLASEQCRLIKCPTCGAAASKATRPSASPPSLRPPGDGTLVYYQRGAFWPRNVRRRHGQLTAQQRPPGGARPALSPQKGAEPGEGAPPPLGHCPILPQTTAPKSAISLLALFLPCFFAFFLALSRAGQRADTGGPEKGSQNKASRPDPVVHCWQPARLLADALHM